MRGEHWSLLLFILQCYKIFNIRHSAHFSHSKAHVVSVCVCMCSHCSHYLKLIKIINILLLFFALLYSVCCKYNEPLCVTVNIQHKHLSYSIPYMHVEFPKQNVAAHSILTMFFTVGWSHFHLFIFFFSSESFAFWERPDDNGTLYHI